MRAIVPSASIVIISSSSSAKATATAVSAEGKTQDSLPTVAIGAAECQLPSAEVTQDIKNDEDTTIRSVKQRQRHDSPDVGVLAAREEPQSGRQPPCGGGYVCVPDESSSLGGRCRENSDGKSSSPISPIKSDHHGRVVDPLSSSHRPMVKLAKRVWPFTPSRRRLQYSSCEPGCSQEFCDCFDNNYEMRGCGAVMQSLCANGTLATCVGGEAYETIYCNMADCLVDGSIYGVCICGLYTDYYCDPSLETGPYFSQETADYRQEMCESMKLCCSETNDEDIYDCVPGFSPTQSPTVKPWYIDWRTFTCKRGNPDEEFSVQLFETVEACCEGSFPTSTSLAESCLADSTIAPTASRYFLPPIPAPGNGEDDDVFSFSVTTSSPAPGEGVDDDAFSRDDDFLVVTPPIPIVTSPILAPPISPSVPAFPTVSPAPSTNRKFCGVTQEDAQNRCEMAIPCPEGDSIVCLQGQSCFEITGPCLTATDGTSPGDSNGGIDFSPTTPPPTWAPPPPTVSPTQTPTAAHVFDRNAINFCGTDFDDVVNNCFKNKLCPTGNTSECPDGQMCFPGYENCNTPYPTMSLAPTGNVVSKDPNTSPTVTPPTEEPTLSPTEDVITGDDISGGALLCVSGLILRSLLMGGVILGALML